MTDKATTDAPDTTDADALEQEAVTESTSYDVEFDGHTYTVLDGQPGPKAMGYIADYVDTDNGIYATLFIKAMIGKTGWDAWCERHQTIQIHGMLMALNKGYAGKS